MIVMAEINVDVTKIADGLIDQFDTSLEGYYGITSSCITKNDLDIFIEKVYKAMRKKLKVEEE